MKLIVGLGNPGERYKRTRHNVGFMAVEELARQFSIFNFQFSLDKNLKAEILKTKYKGEELILVKTQTFMNKCGWPVKKLVDWYHVRPVDLWVVHDDLDLPLGKIKIRKGGGTAGHHGLESIAEQLGTTDFVRFRLGIGRPQGRDEWEKINVKRKEIEDYVLSDFTPEEGKEVRELVKKGSKAVQIGIEKGLEKVMNRFNH